jgi:hypothetical protein
VRATTRNTNIMSQRTKRAKLEDAAAAAARPAPRQTDSDDDADDAPDTAAPIDEEDVDPTLAIAAFMAPVSRPKLARPPSPPSPPSSATSTDHRESADSEAAIEAGDQAASLHLSKSVKKAGAQRKAAPVKNEAKRARTNDVEDSSAMSVDDAEQPAAKGRGRKRKNVATSVVRMHRRGLSTSR